MGLIVICEHLKALETFRLKKLSQILKSNLITGFSEQSNEEKSQFSSFLSSDVFFNLFSYHRAFKFKGSFLIILV